MIHRYLLVLAACASVLIGIQAPNFADQYEKRLDAHFSEAATNLHGYQRIADRFFDGSMTALIEKHRHSADPVFRAEAEPIQALYMRYHHFLDERRSLATGLPGKIAFILAHGDRQLIDETAANYSFTIPLNGPALASGLLVMAVTVLLIELLRIAAMKLWGATRHKAASPR